ncbi:MAG TPA: NAD(+) synthase [Candidatus Woesearchaeota archaeon]|nr:NAD(+) synthase [Candidatus Woesearchaeota archaeon]
MKLGAEALKIDCEKVSGRIERFIIKNVKNLSKKGVIVPVSGGLDSSVVAGLCVRAVGKDKVFGLMLPEKEGNPDAKKYALLLCRKLGICHEEIDISNVLKAFGNYDFVLSKIPSRLLKKVAAGSFLSLYNPLKDGLKGKGNAFVRKGMSYLYLKNRVRFVFACKYAEENNLVLAGSAHKSEDMVGLFVKFGVDDLADIMPLKNLFRSQVLQIGKHIGIPQEILSRKPNPDIIPGVEDKYWSFLRLAPEKVDLVLLGLEKGMKKEQIARDVGVPKKKVEEVEELTKISFHMRNPNLAP